MNAHIYLVTNTITGKQYVGQTTIERNKVGHGYAMTDAYNAYGKDAFTYEKISTGINNRNTLNYIEKFFIKAFNTISPNGYNIEAGGSDKGFVPKSTRQKLRKHNLGKVMPQEIRQKISNSLKGAKNPFYGKTHSPEVIAKIIAANVGKVVVITEEQKQKISQANKGEKNGMYGKKHTPEAHAKMALARLKRYGR